MNKFWLASLVSLTALLGACAPTQTAELTPQPAISALKPGQRVSVASPLYRAHAHNDYEHERPLLDALAQGFTSVESDVFLRDGQLLVAHEASQIQSGRTLQSLYLEPLRQIAQANNGRIYADQSLTLYIDVKDDGEATYQAIDRALAPYAGMLTRYENGQVTPGAVTVVISGNRVPATMRPASALRRYGWSSERPRQHCACVPYSNYQRQLDQNLYLGRYRRVSRR